MAEGTVITIDDLESMGSDQVDSFNIDSLLEGIGGIEGSDLAGFGSVDTVIDAPHIKMDTKALLEFIKAARLVINQGARDIHSKALSILATPAGVVLRVTDMDTYLEATLPVLNDQNLLEDHIAIPLDVVAKIIRAAPSRISLVRRAGENGEGKYTVTLVGGEMVLEVYQVDVDKFVCSDLMAPLSQVQSQPLLAVLKDLAGFVQASVSPSERRIVFGGSQAMASYMWSIIQSTSEMPACDMKLKDISVLRQLLTGQDQPLQVFKSDGTGVARMMIKAKDFTYAWVISDLVVSAALKASMNEVLQENYVHVDLVQLYKIIDLAAELSYSTGRVGINFDPSGNLTLSIGTKKGSSSDFKIDGSRNGEIAPFKEPIFVQAKLLRLVLRAFAGTMNIKVSMGEGRGIGIRSEKYEAAIYSEARH